MKVYNFNKRTFILATVVSTSVLLSSSGFAAEKKDQQKSTQGHNLITQFPKMLQALEEAKKKFYPPSKRNDRIVVPYRIGAEPPKRSNESENTIEYALNKINKANQNASILGQIQSPTANCRDCSDPVQSMRYNTCNDKNDYLESEIKTAKDGKGLLAELIRAPLRGNSTIKASCIQMGMSLKFGPNDTSFRSCNGNTYSGRAVRPCLSENYFKMIANSFDAVSSCMTEYISPGEGNQAHQQDILAVFAMINVESGFHVNAVSGTGAGGIGQFTATAIEQVNKNDIKKVRTMLGSSSNKLCQRLSSEVLSDEVPMQASANRSCDRIAMKNGNPVINMIYTYASLKGVKKDMNNTIFDNKNYSAKFSHLSLNEVNKIKRALMIWSHNTGPSGTWTPAKALLNSYYRSKSIGSADEFLKKMEEYMRAYPASSNKTASRRKETSNYYPKISNALKKIETNIGGGSCLN